MLRNYLKIAWRNLWKAKLYTTVNILGLASAIAACILIALFVRYELTYDQHNLNVDRIVRISTTFQTPEEDMAFATSATPLADVLQGDYPEVEAVARLESSPATVKYQNELIRESGFYESEQHVFSVFTFSFLAGDATHALTAPETLVLTERVARKYFGTSEKAIGEILTCNDKPYRITAVVADPPKNADIQIEGLLSADFSQRVDWSEIDFPLFTFALLREGTDLKTLESKLEHLSKQYVQPELDAAGAKEYHARFLAERLADVHFSKSKLMDTPKGNKQFNYALSLLALFILFTALLNYINLATARVSERAKEVGVRKVSGARPLQLIGQFLVESFVLIGLAWLAAISLAVGLIPYFNKLLHTQISLSWQEYGPLLLGIFTLTTLLAALYPALSLTAYQPVEVLKGNWKTTLKAVVLRRGTVLLQFVIATVMIAGAIVVYRQIHFIMHSDKGFNLNRTLSVRLPTDEEDRAQVKAFSEALRQLPGVENLTAGSGLQEDDLALATTFVQSNGQQRELMCNYLMIDQDFVPLFELEVLKGRNLSDSLATDKREAFLVNEAFVHTMGWSNAIGQSIAGFDHKGKVVGVVKNFYYKSMHNLVEPLVMTYNTWPPTLLSLKVSPQELPQIERVWKGFFPNRILDYTFLDEAYAAQYEQDRIFTLFFTYFTLLAILISCLGLYALVALMTTRRVKEIGIRKVLGASVMNIITLISSDFVKLIGLAILIAVPIAWWAMDRWLADFTYRMEMQWWVFVLAGMTTLAIALLTLSWQAVRAALNNPVDAIRDE